MATALGGLLALTLGFGLQVLNDKANQNNDRIDRTNDRITSLENKIDARFEKLEDSIDKLEDAINDISINLAVLIAALGKTEQVESAIAAAIPAPDD